MKPLEAYSAGITDCLHVIHTWQCVRFYLYSVYTVKIFLQLAFVCITHAYQTGFQK